MRKTKIVCTIGPACETEEIITGMCKAGMNVARLNFSHGTHEEQKKRIDVIKKVRKELGLPIAILLDTKGPEFRIGTFENKKIFLADGAPFVFTSEDIVGNEARVSVSYKNLPEELEPGDTVLVNDGLIELRVERTEGTEIYCTTVIGGELSDRKSMSFPGKVLRQTFLSEQDKKDIAFGIEQGVDYIACSFVSRKQDLDDVHEFLREQNANDIELIAKIENQAGCENFDEICESCNGIMVARGDLGVEIAFEQLPAIQKDMISRCRMLGRRVITATEMLESMTHNPRPTRAEISDVANAVYDGTSAIMLSGETAAGKYPVQAVATMAKIAETTEQNINYKKRFYKTDFLIKNVVDAISHATCATAIDIESKAIVVCSLSGRTARLVSRFRPPVDLIGLTTSESTWRKLALSWGVIPALCENFSSTDVLFYTAKKIAEKKLSLEKGDLIVITGGATLGQSGSTNLIKIDEIGTY